MTAPLVSEFHRVKPGDTLDRLALRYSRSLGELVEWNCLRYGQALVTGDRLRVAPRTY